MQVRNFIYSGTITSCVFRLYDIASNFALLVSTTRRKYPNAKHRRFNKKEISYCCWRQSTSISIFAACSCLDKLCYNHSWSPYWGTRAFNRLTFATIYTVIDYILIRTYNFPFCVLLLSSLCSDIVVSRRIFSCFYCFVSTGVCRICRRVEIFLLKIWLFYRESVIIFGMNPTVLIEKRVC